MNWLTPPSRTPSPSQARADYEQSVVGINTMQHEVFLSQLPQMLESLRIIAENMVAVMNNALKSFSEMQQLLMKGESGKVCCWVLHVFLCVFSPSLVPRPRSQASFPGPREVGEKGLHGFHCLYM